MSSLEADFQLLKERLRHGADLRPTSGDPITYFLFPPDKMLDLKRRLKAWKAQLQLEEREVTVLSLAEVIGEFFREHPLRQFWLSGEAADPCDLESINTTLKEALMESDVVVKKILSVLASMEAVGNGVLLITDVEAAHPYMRISSIEERLQGKVHVPVVIFYPGTRCGKFNRKFLDIYPEDGNYRSDIIGG